MRYSVYLSLVSLTPLVCFSLAIFIVFAMKRTWKHALWPLPILAAFLILRQAFVYHVESVESEAGEVIVVSDLEGQPVRIEEGAVHCPLELRHCTLLPKSALSTIKARHGHGLSYVAVSEVVNPALFFKACGPHPGELDTRENNRLRVVDTVSSQLYEFNVAHSEELAKFNNPLDHEQGSRLESLLHTFLDERLAAKGLRLVRLQSWSFE